MKDLEFEGSDVRFGTVSATPLNVTSLHLVLPLAAPHLKGNTVFWMPKRLDAVNRINPPGAQMANTLGEDAS